MASGYFLVYAYGLTLLLHFVISVEDVPVITEQPESSVVRRNDPHTLNCAADKNAQIRWFHNGEILTDQSSDPTSHRMLLPTGSLFFLRFVANKKYNDTGTYWCVASNSNGSTRSQNATLDIAYISDGFVQEPPPSVHIVEGETLVLPCQAPRGNPPPTISWSRNGLDIPNDGRIYISDSGDLAFRKIQIEDSAVYECEASNFAGTKKTPSTILTVISPPRFIVAPNNRTVTTGSTISLPCEVSGNPKPKVDWLRLDGKIPLQRASISFSYTLQLSEVAPSDAGHYACIADNEAGMIRAEFFIEVLTVPVISAKPSDQVLKVGGSKRMPCGIKGDPQPLILWRLPGEDPNRILLAGNKKGRMTATNEGDLLMADLQLLDSGLYSCLGANSGGGVSARARILTVEAFPPPAVGVAPQDQTIAVEETIILPCEPVSEFDEASVSWWFKSSIHLPETEILSDMPNGITISDRGTLVIESAYKNNSGIYTCRIKTISGLAEATAVVNFDESSDTSSYFSTLTPAPPSKPRVKVLNDTSVKLFWQPNSSEMRKASQMAYMIEYWRDGWNEWRIANPFVKSENIIVSDLSPNYTYTFFVRSLSGSQHSFPSPWSNPIRLEVLTNNLILPKARFLNDPRIDKSTVRLLKAEVESFDSVLLSWQGSEQDKEDGVLVYYIEYNENDQPSDVNVATVFGSSSSSHLVSGLKPFTKYVFFLVPFWRSLEGTPSNSIELTTPEKIPSRSPHSLHISKMSLSEALITWQPMNSTKLPGKLLGYTVALSCNDTITNHNVTTPWLDVKNLLPYCYLTAKVAAMTTTGTGPYSYPVSFQMKDYHPTNEEKVSPVNNDLIYRLLPLYIILPIVFILFSFCCAYLAWRRIASKRHSDKCHSVCSSRCQVSMYSEHPKAWTVVDTPRTEHNSYLLRGNHYINDYAEPNNLLTPSPNQVEAYTTTTLMNQTPQREMAHQWSGFVAPPPPSCPPPPLTHCSSSEGGTMYSSSSYNSEALNFQNRSNRRDDQTPLCSEIYKKPCEDCSEHAYEAYQPHIMNSSPHYMHHSAPHSPPQLSSPNIPHNQHSQHTSPSSPKFGSNRSNYLEDGRASRGGHISEKIPLRVGATDDNNLVSFANVQNNLDR